VRAPSTLRNPVYPSDFRYRRVLSFALELPLDSSAGG